MPRNFSSAIVPLPADSIRFMEYDLGYIDLEEKTLQPLENPFGPKLSPMS